MSGILQNGIRPLPLSNKKIIEQAEALSLAYAEIVGADMAMLGITFNRVYEEVIYPDCEIEILEDQELGVDSGGEKILGAFDAVANHVFIDASIGPASRDPRRVFTLWHEVGGHGVLQGEWLRRELKRLNQSGPIITTEAMLSPKVESTLERQANLFASHAAAPTWLVARAIRDTLQLSSPYVYVGPASYQFDLKSGRQEREIESFSDLCACIALFIQRYFGKLSVEALSYRVQESDWVSNRVKNENQNVPFGFHRTASIMRKNPK